MMKYSQLGIYRGVYGYGLGEDFLVISILIKGEKNQPPHQTKL